ncbi:MAG: hypothetical protein GPOALKHO_001762 [Sodalis sp.]|nr:MAG: hypothetical protein GPOALKHO_001762 [Sodalis sp.]
MTLDAAHAARPGWGRRRYRSGPRYYIASPTAALLHRIADRMEQNLAPLAAKSGITVSPFAKPWWPTCLLRLAISSPLVSARRRAESAKSTVITTSTSREFTTADSLLEHGTGAGRRPVLVLMELIDDLLLSGVVNAVKTEQEARTSDNELAPQQSTGADVDLRALYGVCYQAG